MAKESSQQSPVHTAAAKHPIKVVARRTGLSADLIRAWERRYGAVYPQRSDTRRRLYTDADVEKLRLLRRATEAGRRIGDVAQLPLAALTDLVGADESAEAQAPQPTPPREPKSSAQEHLQACLSAVQRMDTAGLESSLVNAAVSLGTPVMLDEVIHPLLETIGEQCRQGAIRISNEHFASAVIRSYLGPLVTSANMTGIGPGMIITTPAGQWHELGALMAAVTAASAGWHTVYLGPNMPAEEIAFAAAENEAAVVAVSVACFTDERTLPAELRKLRRYLSQHVQLWVGGSTARRYADVLTEVGAVRLENLQALRLQLERNLGGLG